MNINVTKEALQGPPAIPSAIYKGVISGSNTRQSKNDNTVLNLEVTIASQGPDPEVNTVGRKVFISMTMTEKAIGIVARDYKGITGQDMPLGNFTVDELIGRITSDCMNKEVLVQVETKPHPNDPDRMVSNVAKVDQAEA